MRDKKIEYTSYCIQQIPSELCIAQQHFPSKDILNSANFPARKTWPEEQIFWGTDPLGAPDLNFVQESKKGKTRGKQFIQILPFGFTS